MAVDIPAMPRPAQKSLLALSAFIGRELPEAYLAFVSRHDGAEPSPNLFPVGADNDSAVRQFIAADDAVRVLETVDGFPQRVIPLAEDDCGNFVYLDPLTGEIFFWDHELEGANCRLASDLAGFLSLLRPFDATSVRPESGQVVSAWIDADFLNDLRRRGEA